MTDTFSVKDLKLLFKYHFLTKPADGPTPVEKEMGVYSLDLYLDKYYKDILKFKEDFSISILSTIFYNDKKYPVFKICLNKKKEKRLLILCGVHGNEQAGLLVVPKLLADIKKKPRNYENISITIVTPINPVGADNFSRFNGEGEDINRDFKLFKTKEARLVKSVFNQINPDFVITCHEGPQIGTFIYGHKDVDQNLIDAILKRLKENKISLATKNYFGIKLKIPGYTPLKGVTYFMMKVWKFFFNKLAFGMYCAERGVPIVTIESSWRSKDANERISSQLLVVKAIVNEMSK